MWRHHPNFRWIFHDNSKNKNQRIFFILTERRGFINWSKHILSWEKAYVSIPWIWSMRQYVSIPSNWWIRLRVRFDILSPYLEINPCNIKFSYHGINQWYDHELLIGFRIHSFTLQRIGSERFLSDVTQTETKTTTIETRVPWHHGTPIEGAPETLQTS